MLQHTAIAVNQVSKIYHIYDKTQDRLKQSLWLGKRKFYREFWALKNICLDIKKGDTVGIIGRNGSGKSTLLQIIAGTLTPTSGQLQVNGRVSALLELGSGFNPELTGRENAKMNGYILGLTPKEVEERMPYIEQFAEIGDFIDQPVKLYSSGMFVRLAFACAVNVDPDILIVDEALAVGDLHFQLKCIEKMKSFKRAGKTILFVSHDTYSVKNFCDHAVWMREGKVCLRGDANTVTYEYEEFMKQGISMTAGEPAIVSTKEDKPHILSIEQIAFYNSQRQCKRDFHFAEPITVEVIYKLNSAVEGVVGGIALYDKNNNYVCGLNTKLDDCVLPSKPGRYRLTIHYDDMKLLPGTYFVDVGFFDSSAVVSLDYKSRFDYFRINNNGDYFAEGVTFIPHRWQCTKDEI